MLLLCITFLKNTTVIGNIEDNNPYGIFHKDNGSAEAVIVRRLVALYI